MERMLNLKPATRRRRTSATSGLVGLRRDLADGAHDEQHADIAESCRPDERRPQASGGLAPGLRSHGNLAHCSVSMLMPPLWSRC
jgi:hypothetical protein